MMRYSFFSFDEILPRYSGSSPWWFDFFWLISVSTKIEYVVINVVTHRKIESNDSPNDMCLSDLALGEALM